MHVRESHRFIPSLITCQVYIALEELKDAAEERRILFFSLMGLITNSNNSPATMTPFNFAVNDEEFLQLLRQINRLARLEGTITRIADQCRRVLQVLPVGYEDPVGFLIASLRAKHFNRPAPDPSLSTVQYLGVVIAAAPAAPISARKQPAKLPFDCPKMHLEGSTVGYLGALAQLLSVVFLLFLLFLSMLQHSGCALAMSSQSRKKRTEAQEIIFKR